MTLSTTAFAQGTQAARPAAAPGNLSFFYYETDTGLFYQSNGTDWVLVAPGTLAITPIGLTGATAPVRWVGGTASGAPASGTFAVGDFVIDQTGSLWICTAAGSPGTWAAVGGGMANPMSALGDLISGGAAGAPARVAGNATATRKFLRQTGTGSASAAPAWDTLEASDVPDLSADYDPAGTAAGDVSAHAATVNHPTMTGDAGSGGVKGLVPAPAAGDAAAGKFLGAGGGWSVPGGGGSGGMTLIQSIVVGSGGAASVTFSSIPQTYSHLLVIAQARSDTQTTYDFTAQINGDTGNNYQDEAWGNWGSNSNAYSNRARFGYCTDPRWTAGCAAQSQTLLVNYAGTTFFKMWRGQAMWQQSPTSNPELDEVGGTWNNTAAVTQITLAPDNGNFIQGSNFSLYGLG